MLEAAVEVVEDGCIVKHRVMRDGALLAYANVLSLWQTDAGFRSFYISSLAESDFPAYRWETRPVTKDTVGRPFEFVLVNTPEFASRRSDRGAFKNHFTADDADHGIVVFDNLGKDATLVVPSPRADDHAYGHLAAFVRQAPRRQVDALWQVVGRTMAERIGDSPLWLSTAGGGVAWLHVRLDSRPKYYAFSPYKRFVSIA